MSNNEIPERLWFPIVTGILLCEPPSLFPNAPTQEYVRADLVPQPVASDALARAKAAEATIARLSALRDFEAKTGMRAGSVPMRLLDDALGTPPKRASADA